ncbi:uncharacterized protein B0T23DRAFT_115294 [Neurospora hispaniola]|uniref:Uncharacterized protein n=1 Tax=Neurospora hispaniola TaxID=588809 RepID=A0AAJ0MSU5_9PEZI|nr:hypothetical protein B0T23DRAFT_115294 [Neurospora hispaniola]
MIQAIDPTQPQHPKGTSAVDRAGDQDHAKRCHPPRLLFRTAPEHPTYFQRLELISTAPGLSSDATPETVDTCSPRLQLQSRACQAWDKGSWSGFFASGFDIYTTHYGYRRPPGHPPAEPPPAPLQSLTLTYYLLFVA